MDAKQAILANMEMSTMVFKGYVGDLSDSELLARPGDGCNHMAWQLGHLIASEVQLLESICPGTAAELPEGFAEAHSKETSSSDDPAAFQSLQEYLTLFDTVRAATQKALEELSDESLDQESPESFRQFCPTVGHMFVLISSHPMMHAGQAVPVRRRFGKPVLF